MLVGAMSLNQKIIEDLKSAMKEKDSLRTSCLRMLKTSLKNKQVEMGRELKDEEIQSVISSMVRKGREAIKGFKEGGREDLARKEEQEIDRGHRQGFSVDADRILHSLAYSRYIDKTQVFYLIKNDHITHRVLHVQLVSKIARTIGRLLRLNEDLIEAIALGHDIGHTPFGHDGEKFLSALCESHGIGPFLHNIQGVKFLQEIERKGRGWNPVKFLYRINSHFISNSR